jgi:hypothetical protein
MTNSSNCVAHDGIIAGAKVVTATKRRILGQLFSNASDAERAWMRL